MHAHLSGTPLALCFSIKIFELFPHFQACVYQSTRPSKMTQFSAVAIGSVALFIIALRSFLRRSQDDIREPPAVRSTIPLVGHILGLIRYKNYYYKILR